MCNHGRNSIYCILPPQVLLNIARNGNAQEREFALKTLANDQTVRSSRLAFTLLGGLKLPHPADMSGTPSEKRSIYDAQHATDLPGRLIRKEGDGPVADVAVNQAYDGLGDTFNFYLKTYDRNSIDNAGLPLIASVHYDQNYDNAFWNGQQMVFGDGDNVIFTGFTGATDVIGHELTHGVTGSEANLTYHGQPGALNESISDVFGVMVKQYKLNQTADKADWLIGAGILAKGIHGVALRSMKAPGTAYDDPKLGKDNQPADMAHYVHTNQDDGGVHTNSGIPNHAFYLAATAIGGYSWVKAGQIWYDTLVDHNLKSNATFATFANLTISHAGSRYGAGGVEQKAVQDAWLKVGVIKKASGAGA
ncbi:MAG TPA: M4 family metallopeptidase [Bryobacteraceae bacterium]